MELDSMDSLGLAAFGEYEPLATRLLARVVKPGDTAVDVGAHIGYHTLLLARLVGPQGQVIAFEPEPKNCSLLERNVRRNGYRNVVVERMAVLDGSEAVELYLSEMNLGDHRVYPAESVRRAISVPATSLDRYFGAQTSIQFLKVDTQGAEVAVLRGVENLIGHHHPRILAEFWPEGLRLSGSDPTDLVDLLRDYEYVIYEVDELRKRIALADVPTLISLYDTGDAGVNLYCVWQEDKSGLVL